MTDIVIMGKNEVDLYAAMHRLDHLQLDVIIAQRMPDQGLVRTMNDKLIRASKK